MFTLAETFDFSFNCAYLEQIFGIAASAWRAHEDSLTMELQSGGKRDCQHALKFAYHGLRLVHTLKALLRASRTGPSTLHISIHILCPRNPLTRKYICKDCQEIFRFIAWSVIRFTTARSSV